MSTYSAYFGFKSEPFTSEISAKNLLKLPSMIAVKERFDYVMNGGVFVFLVEMEHEKEHVKLGNISIYPISLWHVGSENEVWEGLTESA